MYDIIVIGAGPGGSTAAKIAAENGYSVCILEKENIGENGRYKACGGAITWKIITELNYPEEKISRIVESLELHHTDGEIYSKKGKGAVVCRKNFDKYLSDIALESGAVLKESEGLKNIQMIDDYYILGTDNGKYKCKYVIAADGVNSRTLKLLNWPKFRKEDLILTITREMKSQKSNIENILGKDKLHLFFGINDLISMGYAWLFPKSEIITVGWGCKSDLIKNFRVEFNKFLDLDMVKKTLKNATVALEKVHLIPVGIREKIFDENVFAIGDSAGFVDPISGKGIPYAMMSGKIAIETIKYCENKEKLDQMGTLYEKKLNSKFLNVLKAKKISRSKIFENDENLKKFLSLWETHRSSEIVMKKMI